MTNNRNNMFLAIALSALVIFAWQYFVVRPQMKAEQAKQATLAHQVKAKPQPQTPERPAASVPGMSGSATHMSRDAALKAEGARVAIDSPLLDGSIALKGAKFDDLRLKKYRETTDPKSPEIVLLAPKSTDYPYYAQFGWVGGANMPTDDSVWTQQGSGALSPGHPVTLTWDNGHGLTFTRVIAVDDQYMFTVSDSVANHSANAETLYPFAFVAREGVPQERTTWVLHEGFVGVAHGSETDASYSDFKDADAPAKNFSSTGGWLGITDKYWMAAVIPPQNRSFDGTYRGTTTASGVKAYQANYRLPAEMVAPGGKAEVSHRLFAGAKVVDILRGYESSQGIARFDNAIDWGWFWFLTQPLFWLLDYFFKFIGNFGLAILMLTVVVKLIFFPLANASFKSMSKMKKVQPQMEEIRKRHKDDPQLQQKEMMDLYKREKVNPVAGCVPMLIQIPVFFSLYKVLYVTIEMRHAPFFGWINDLSAPDPTSILNLFGLFPYHIPLWVPAYLSIGIWPILMGVTQFIQTKLNPAPTDPVQAKMFTFMPIIFTFMFATFPAGLVIYYTWNNLLSVTQQYVIMRREGVKVHLFENLKLKRAS